MLFLSFTFIFVSAVVFLIMSFSPLLVVSIFSCRFSLCCCFYFIYRFLYLVSFDAIVVLFILSFSPHVVVFDVVFPGLCRFLSIFVVMLILRHFPTLILEQTSDSLL